MNPLALFVGVGDASSADRERAVDPDLVPDPRACSASSSTRAPAGRRVPGPELRAAGPHDRRLADVRDDGDTILGAVVASMVLSVITTVVGLVVRD